MRLTLALACSLLLAASSGAPDGHSSSRTETRQALRGTPFGGNDGIILGLMAEPSGLVGGVPLAAVTRHGWATWYDDGPGLYGAVPSYRWGDERYTVQVCGFEGGRTNCVLVTIRDFCACGSRRGIPTVIDLSPAAFRALAPLSRGVIRVTVDNVRGPAPRAIPTAPATDR